MLAGARRELTRLLMAVQYFTRLPVPAWVGHDGAELGHSARYLSAVGLLVGGLGALIVVCLAPALPFRLVVLASMVGTALVTGALHEDGLADSADGLGGGYTRERALEIMKDSRIGTFGALALALTLLAKFEALVALGARPILGALLAGHALSRAAAVAAMASLPYARGDEGARARRVAASVGPGSAGMAMLVALVPCLWVGRPALAGLAGVVGVWCVGVYTLRRRLGGCTGDTLGGLQQLTELAFYVGLLVSPGRP